MYDVNTFDYIAPSIRKSDRDGQLEDMMKAIDVAIEEIASLALKSSWDIYNADRDELEVISQSLGLYPQPYMPDDILRAYIRSTSQIKNLKGTDTLIQYLVDTLTHFRVYEIDVENGERTVKLSLMKGKPEDFEREQRTLDFLVSKYGRLKIAYIVSYLAFSTFKFNNSIRKPKSTQVKIQDTRYLGIATPITVPLKQIVRRTTNFTLKLDLEVLGFKQPFTLQNI